ncbi:hypothetical protein KKH43_03925 [Patescibacteria group bacterium]|nr:hypothetical protein [Patescibacteria group bacterium]
MKEESPVVKKEFEMAVLAMQQYFLDLKEDVDALQAFEDELQDPPEECTCGGKMECDRCTWKHVAPMQCGILYLLLEDVRNGAFEEEEDSLNGLEEGEIESPSGEFDEPPILLDLDTLFQ